MLITALMNSYHLEWLKVVRETMFKSIDMRHLKSQQGLVCVCTGLDHV